MKKRIIRAISLLLLSVMCAGLLAACVNFDKAERRLEEAGYVVSRYGKGAPEHLVDAVDKDVESSIVATGGPNGESISIIRFKEKEFAEKFYELQKKTNGSKYFMTVERDGRTVIYGWTSAYEVIK